MRFIDIHNHMCWGLDDGSQSLEETNKCLQSCVKEHIERVIFTPHYCEREDTVMSMTFMKHSLQECIDLAKQYGIQGYCGCEFCGRMAGKYCTGAGWSKAGLFDRAAYGTGSFCKYL